VSGLSSLPIPIAIGIGREESPDTIEKHSG